MNLLKKEKDAYGGDLQKKREGRRHGRPLATRSTMHLVLRSSKAVGDWSFRKFERDIQKLSKKFGDRYGVKILSLANVGNHLHFQVKLGSRETYRPFIRGLTSAIAMKVTGASRWNRVARESDGERPLEIVLTRRELKKHIESAIKKGGRARGRMHFWDYRPFTRIVQSYRAFLNLRDYLRINQLEGFGVPRASARFLVERGVLFGNVLSNSS